MYREPESSVESIRTALELLDGTVPNDVLPSEEMQDIQKEYGILPADGEAAFNPRTENAQDSEAWQMERCQALLFIERCGIGEGGWIRDGSNDGNRKSARIRYESGIRYGHVTTVLESLEHDGYIELIRKSKNLVAPTIFDARLTKDGRLVLDNIRQESPNIVQMAETKTKEHLMRQVDFMREEISVASAELGVDSEYAESLVVRVQEDDFSWSPLSADLGGLTIAQVSKIPDKLEAAQKALEEEIAVYKIDKKAA